MDKPKGRNKKLIEKRNKRLISRFYYWNSIIGLKYESCINRLVLEFDITEQRIHDIINENSKLLDDLESNKVGVNQLKTAYPFLIWK